MSNMTLRDVPVALYSWLKQRAAFDHRSMNKEIIALLEDIREKDGKPTAGASAKTIMEISRRASVLPLRDGRSEDDILGYGNDGLPGQS